MPTCGNLVQLDVAVGMWSYLKRLEKIDSDDSTCAVVFSKCRWKRGTIEMGVDDH
jgi:hypothetical protein